MDNTGEAFFDATTTPEDQAAYIARENHKRIAEKAAALRELRADLYLQRENTLRAKARQDVEVRLENELREQIRQTEAELLELAVDAHASSR